MYVFCVGLVLIFALCVQGQGDRIWGECAPGCSVFYQYGSVGFTKSRIPQTLSHHCPASFFTGLCG